MRPQVTPHADAAPDMSRTWGRTSFGHFRVLVPCVLLLLDGLDELRQERISMRYAEGHNLAIVSLARDPGAALTVVRDGLAAAVLVAVEMAGGLLDEALGNVRVFYARRPVTRVNPVDVETELIKRALHNSGGDVALVSRLLGAPLPQVRDLAGPHTDPGPAGRSAGLNGHRPVSRQGGGTT